MSEISEQVGQIIRNARKAKGLTLQELGEKLGVSKATAHSYERGTQNLTIETVSKIAKALDLTFKPVFE